MGPNCSSIKSIRSKVIKILVVILGKNLEISLHLQTFNLRWDHYIHLDFKNIIDIYIIFKNLP